MYAKLCKRLSDEAPNFESQNKQYNNQDESSGRNAKKSTFTRLLLNKCKFEFENRSKASSAFDDIENLTPDEEERRQTAKRKMLGNIKFIGELGKLEIINNSILHECVLELLDKKRRRSRGDSAEDIECLCQIMRTCGRILDTEQGQTLMEQYFKRMEILAKSSELPSRIRFMLRDVIELRRDKWVPRKATNTEGPMPINQIRNDNDDNPTRPSGGYHHQNRRDADRGLGTDLFGRPGMRRPLDVDSLSIIPSSFNMTSPFSSNGFGPTMVPPNVGNYGRYNQRNQGPQSGGFFQNQNRNNQQQHKQQHNSPQNFNNNSNKESTGNIRFNKSKMLIGPPEEVSLRPSANSMTFKQPNLTPTLPLNNGGIDLFRSPIPETPLMRATTLRKASSPPLPLKETAPSIVIKQGPLDKREKNRERKDKGPTKEEVMKKVNALMDDFISQGQNIQDAINAFKDLKIPDRFLRYAVLACYTNSLERGDSERVVTANLIHQLRKENVINANQFHDGWKELVASIAERESAVPCIVSHIAFLTSKSIVEGLMQLSDLAGVTENGQHYPLFLLTLQQLHKSQGKAALTKIFNESKVNLMSQLPEADKTKERLGEILEDRDLTFLYPLLRIQGDIWKQLEADPAPNSLYKWIKEKLDPSYHSDPGFINALVTVLLKYITQETTFPPGSNTNVVPDKSLQEKETNLLQKYQRMLQTILNTTEAQVTAVHSLQVFCLSLGFPKGMLLRWFVALYELSIIEEEAFMRWKEDVNDAYPGKGEALFQVNAWLTYLAEQSSEEEDEDEKGDN